jgi:hypothetical protein
MFRGFERVITGEFWIVSGAVVLIVCELSVRACVYKLP